MKTTNDLHFCQKTAEFINHYHRSTNGTAIYDPDAAFQLRDNRQLTQVVFSVTMRTYVWMFQQSANSRFSFQLLMIYGSKHSLCYATMTL